MIRSTSVFTYEIDNPATALDEIQQQLAHMLPLQKNTAGILQCDPEFIKSGAAAYICDGLHFPIVGGTTASQATNETTGDLLLSILVLTSDDVEFVATHTQGLSENLYSAVAESFQPASVASALPLKLILAFPPIVDQCAGDWYVDAFEQISPLTPVFGSLSVDDTITQYDLCASIYNGESFASEMTYLLLFGNISPRFLTTNIQKNPALLERAVVTRASGNHLYEINNMTTSEFFASIGLAKNGKLLDGIDFIPYLFTMKDSQGDASIFYVRGLIRLEEDGSALYRGAIYNDSELSIGSHTRAGVIKGATGIADQINSMDDVNAVLLFSCIVRRMLVGIDSQLELAEVRKALRPELPFMLSYSGGEICPTGKNPETRKNCFHNYALIACIL